MSEVTEQMRQEPERIGRMYAELSGREYNEMTLTFRATQLFRRDPKARMEWDSRAIAAYREREKELGKGHVIVDE